MCQILRNVEANATCTDDGNPFTNLRPTSQNVDIGHNVRAVLTQDLWVPRGDTCRDNHIIKLG